MCEPVTLMGIGLGISAIGTGVSMYNQYQQGEAAEAAARENRRMAILSARDAIARGQLESGEARMAGTRTIADNTAKFAASGVDVSSGSAAKFNADTRLLSELDAARLTNNAAREAWGLRKQAGAYGRQADAISSSTAFGMTGTALGGLGQLAGGAAQIQKYRKENP